MGKIICNSILAVLFLAALLPAADFKLFKRDLKRSGAVTEQAYPGLTQKLEKKLNGASRTSPIIYKGLVFLGDSSGKVWAFDASGDNSSPVWQYSTSGKVIASLAADSEAVYAISQDGYLYAFNYSSGALLFTHYIGSKDSSSPLVSSGFLYGATGYPNTFVYCFNLTTRSMAWTKDVGQYIYSSPALWDGIVYIGANNGCLYALNANTGETKWFFQTKGDVYLSSPCVSADGNWVYFTPGNDDRKIYALNAKTGEKKSGWAALDFGTTPTVVSSITEEDGILYFISGAAPSTLYAVYTADGTQKWARPLDNPSSSGMLSSPVAVNGVIYAGSAANKLYAVKAADGTIINTYTTLEPVLSSPAAANGKLYACAGENGDGYLYVYQAAKVSALTYPEDGAKVNGMLAVKAVLVNSAFISYKLEYTSTAVISWSTINEASVIPEDGVAGNFNVTGLARGDYTLRLTVNDGTSLNSKATINIFVNNYPVTVTGVTPAGRFNNTAARTLTVTGSGFTGGIDGGPSTVTLVAMNGTALTLPGAGITGTTIPGLIMPAGIGTGVYDITVQAVGGSGTGANMVTVDTNVPVPVGSAYPVKLGGETETLIAPAAYNRSTENSLFIGGTTGKLYSLNADGTTRWPAPFDTGSPLSSAPQVLTESGNIYIYTVNDAGTIFKILDQGSSGTTVWTLALGTGVKAEPIIDRVNKALYVGAGQKFYKIDTTSATVIWDSSAGLSGDLTGSAAVDNFTPGINSCWIGSEGGALYNINTGDGTVHAFFATAGAIKSSPFIDAGYFFGPTNNLFIPSGDGKIYCRASGNLSTTPWTNRSGQDDGSYNTGSPINTVPFVDTVLQDVYFGANDGKLYKLDAVTGLLKAGWQVFQAGGPVYSSPIAYNGTVYFGSDDGKCYALDANNGSLKPNWPVITGAEVKAMPVLGGWNGSNYTSITFTSKDGKVYTLQLP